MKDKTDIKKINLEENEKKKIIEINLKNTDIFRLYILSYAQWAKFAVVIINAE